MPVKDALKTFRALSDPTRLRVVLLLMEQDLCVCELMFILKMEQSRVSHQLRILREAGLIEDVREGRWMIYRVAPGRRNVLEMFMGPPLEPKLRGSADTLRDVRRMNLCLRTGVRQKHEVKPQSTGRHNGRPGPREA